MDEKLIHKYEDRGLGKAPYKYLGEWECPSPHMAGNNPEAFRRIVADAPRVDIGTLNVCQYCGAVLMINHIVLSADGKRFAVGSECIRKYGEESVIRALTKAERIRNKAKRAAYLEKRAKEYDAIFATIADDLSRQDHPSEYYRKQGKTLRDYMLFVYSSENQKSRALSNVKNLRDKILAGKDGTI
jgi:hypothetical protein